MPDHPHAIQSGPNKGNVEYPNVDYNTEMVNALLASRAYEANITAMEATKDMTSSSLRLLAERVGAVVPFVWRRICSLAWGFAFNSRYIIT